MERTEPYGADAPEVAVIEPSDLHYYQPLWTLVGAGVFPKEESARPMAEGALFSSKPYEETLYDVVERKGLEINLMTELIEIRPDDKEAVFRNLETEEEMTVAYDMLHVVPPMSAPDFIAESPISDDEGWVDVDPGTLQHTRYENVFALGDNSNLPTSKTGAAIRKQAPVLVDHLMATINETAPLNGTYNGYTSCPLVTGYGKLVLAEFDYNKEPDESFPFDQTQERYSMYALKAYGLPRMYWNGMLKGRM